MPPNMERPMDRITAKESAEEAEKRKQKELLDTVLSVAGDNEDMIREGIIKALQEVNDKARRTYLWNILERKARERIRRSRQKYAA